MAPLHHADDAELLEAFRGGNDDAFSTLYERYRRRVSAYARRILHKPKEAEEVATEAFIRIVEGGWRPVGSFKNYLFTVVHRLCIDRIRRRQTRERFLPFLQHRAPTVSTPEELLMQDPRMAEVERILAQLPEPHRAAVLLFYGQDLSSKEIAAILALPDQKVRSMLSYARRRLRRELVHRVEEIS